MAQVGLCIGDRTSDDFFVKIGSSHMRDNEMEPTLRRHTVKRMNNIKMIL